IASIDPVEYFGDELPELKRPGFLAIISLHVLATALTRNDAIRPDGFIVEGPLAGGHSAPPRGKMTLDEAGDPIYGAKDEPNLATIAATGLPFWLAGAYASPEKVAEALALGAAGVQIGTLFAFAEESGLRPSLKGALRRKLTEGTLHVRNDPRASPTNFPFKIAEVENTLSEPAVYEARERICDLGYLRTAVEREDGKLAYRCPSEPVHMYLKKGGDIADTVGRKCLCNALMSDVGYGQVRKDGYVEDAALTLGQDLSGPQRLLEIHPEGWTAAQAVEWLTSQVRR
ncbi:MAG TPA: nitronate monooxygenase, partial [Propionibacteriaceae bacterium]|nr:nitronate monooxygenase [Propionibacteriaceae bacterium]